MSLKPTDHRNMSIAHHVLWAAQTAQAVEFKELVFYFKDLATPIERPSNGLCQTDAALQGVIVLLTGTIWELINIAPFKD